MDENYRIQIPEIPFFSWIRGLIIDALWHLLLTVWSFIIPIIKYASYLFIMITISILGYHFLNSKFLPQAILVEPLYFDFSKTPPTATLNMLSLEKQWYYKNGECSQYLNKIIDPPIVISQACNQKIKKRFLKSGFHYFVEVKFSIANSPKNIQQVFGI